MLLVPFRGLAPIWGIAFLSLITAWFALWVYKKFSNQQAIKLIKKRIQGYFLGIYLFRDDIAQIFASLGKLLSNVFRYMGHAFLPLAVMMIPIVLLCVQMQLRYGHSDPAPGDSLTVTARLDPGDVKDLMEMTIEPIGKLEVISPALRISALGEVEWKIRVTGGEGGEVRLAAGEGRPTAAARVGRTGQRLYWAVTKPSLLNCFLYPGEDVIAPGSPVREIRLSYASAKVSLAGFPVHWSIAYFLLAILFGLLFKPLFKVEF